jgi:filamentous hemagglutinin family protein
LAGLFRSARAKPRAFSSKSVSSAVLNRIVGQDPSVILGTLSSNGRVFLVNPNGILFGQGSRVDVGGLVASTLNITDRDFLAGRLNFQAGAVANSIVNQGEIVSSSGGRIYLVAPDVQNHGLISSPSGEVVLAAGKSVSLVDADVPNLQVEVQAGGEALNVGKILAEGGKVGIYAGLINQRGLVRADSVSKDATGRIVFKASDTTILDAGSVTSAAGAKGGEIQVLGQQGGPGWQRADRCFGRCGRRYGADRR